MAMAGRWEVMNRGISKIPTGGKEKRAAYGKCTWPPSMMGFYGQRLKAILLGINPKSLFAFAGWETFGYPIRIHQAAEFRYLTTILMRKMCKPEYHWAHLQNEIFFL